jgi:hypothetical protein
VVKGGKGGGSDKDVNVEEEFKKSFDEAMNSLDD